MYAHNGKKYSLDDVLSDACRLRPTISEHGYDYCGVEFSYWKLGDADLGELGKRVMHVSRQSGPSADGTEYSFRGEQYSRQDVLDDITMIRDGYDSTLPDVVYQNFGLRRPRRESVW